MTTTVHVPHGPSLTYILTLSETKIDTSFTFKKYFSFYHSISSLSRGALCGLQSVINKMFMLLYQKSFDVHFPASFRLVYFERSLLIKIFVTTTRNQKSFFPNDNFNCA